MALTSVRGTAKNKERGKKGERKRIQEEKVPSDPRVEAGAVTFGSTMNSWPANLQSNTVSLLQNDLKR